jgi:hypothetical protein
MPILAQALLTMATAQLLDLATFVTMIHRLGPRAEANPFVVELLGAGGLPEVVLAKILLVALVGSVAVALVVGRVPSARRAGGLLLAIAIAAGVLGGWSNVLTMGPL